VRLVTFNTWNARAFGPGSVDLMQFASAIQSLEPDILGLQEVDLDQPRSHRADLTAVAAEAMGAVSSRFVPCLDGTPGALWKAIAGEPTAGHPLYGVALLSRYPAHDWDVLRLPDVGPHFPLRVPGRRTGVLIGEEPRSVVLARFETPLGAVTVANTHLSFLPGWNVVQLRRITRRLAKLADPVVILGDLNLPGGLPGWTTGYRPLARHATYPVHRPSRQLDHILLRGTLGAVTRTAAVELAISDHRALVVELDHARSETRTTDE
jgi:endonuclease/exonuclease/phosphatase family metal-dependent hydrolase